MTSPAIDGHNKSNVSGGPSTTIALTTTQANDIIIVCAYAEANNGSITPKISAVSGTGTTGWAERKSVVGTGGTGFALSVWWGKAAAALSAVSLSVTFDHTFDDASLVAFGVSGATFSAPFDPELTLPKGVTAARNTAPSTTITTTDADDLLLAFVGSTNSTLSQVNTPPSGWTSIDATTNGGGGLFSQVGAASLSVSTVQSGTTVTWGAAVGQINASDGVPYILDALTSDLATVSVNKTEAMSLSESSSAVLILPVTAAESMSLAETSDAIALLPLTETETIALVDSSDAILTIPVSISEALALAFTESATTMQVSQSVAPVMVSTLSEPLGGSGGGGGGGGGGWGTIPSGGGGGGGVGGGGGGTVPTGHSIPLSTRVSQSVALVMLSNTAPPGGSGVSNETLFPPNLSYGAVGGAGWKTVVAETSVGFEFRTSQWNNSIGRWTVGHNLRQKSDWEGLQAFHRIHQGRLGHFRFKDWTDFNVTTGEGVIIYVPLFPYIRFLAKRYFLTDVFGNNVQIFRRIFKPRPYSVVFDPPGPYVDYSSGQVFGASLTTLWTGQFDNWVRFDEDAPAIALDQPDAAGWRNINLIEVRWPE